MYLLRCQHDPHYLRWAPITESSSHEDAGQRWLTRSCQAPPDAMLIHIVTRAFTAEEADRGRSIAGTPTLVLMVPPGGRTSFSPR